MQGGQGIRFQCYQAKVSIFQDLLLHLQTVEKTGTKITDFHLLLNCYLLTTDAILNFNTQVLFFLVSFLIFCGLFCNPSVYLAV